MRCASSFSISKVVVSSSWRQRRSIPDLEEMLSERGYSGGTEDVTPRLPRPVEGEQLVRAKEIADGQSHHPEVGSFAIVDDDLEFGALAEHHVWVEPSTGFSDANVAHATALRGTIDASHGES